VRLGTGKKLFRDGAPAVALRLTGSSTTSTGVVITTYEPAGPPRYGSFTLDEAELGLGGTTPLQPPAAERAPR